MASAELVKKIDSQPMFGAGNDSPAQERNFQEIEWRLPSGDRVRFETWIFQLDGQNPYAQRGGPSMPMYRVLEIKKKGFIGWKTLAKAMEYRGGFAALNSLIRSTDTYQAAEAEGRGDEVQISKLSYVHGNFGEHEYYGLTEPAPLEALTELLGNCGSAKEFMDRLERVDQDPDDELAAEKSRLKEELDELRSSVSRS
jgi:hypothetical protein